MGFGNPIGTSPDAVSARDTERGLGHGDPACWPPGLGVEVDEITETYELEPAPEDIRSPPASSTKGTVAAMRFEINGHGRAASR